jgi:hypothetical protein
MNDPNDMARMMAMLQMQQMMECSRWYAERKIDARRMQIMLRRGIRRLGILLVRLGYWLQRVGYVRYIE